MKFIIGLLTGVIFTCSVIITVWMASPISRPEQNLNVPVVVQAPGLVLQPLPVLAIK